MADSEDSIGAWCVRWRTGKSTPGYTSPSSRVSRVSSVADSVDSIGASGVPGGGQGSLLQATPHPPPESPG